ncbi:unnamed protein product [Allacma fusca]|uniref:Uncharacterized protein n=1 Tax=Allacma fusca TaxID=39272 RepID=A0A8J2JCK4_9HEXA|nr:unnamed protein product [Allacma fusca]
MTTMPVALFLGIFVCLLQTSTQSFTPHQIQPNTIEGLTKEELTKVVRSKFSKNDPDVETDEDQFERGKDYILKVVLYGVRAVAMQGPTQVKAAAKSVLKSLDESKTSLEDLASEMYEATHLKGYTSVRIITDFLSLLVDRRHPDEFTDNLEAVIQYVGGFAEELSFVTKLEHADTYDFNDMKDLEKFLSKISS